MAKAQNWLERGRQVLISNYGRFPIVMERGEGAFLFDADGKRYLDLFAGFGGAILGHCHPALIDAATAQARQLWHTGNSFYTQPQIELAERLGRIAFPGQAFFCHSGLEANEAACKLARIRHKDSQPKRYKILSLHRSFHGRSLAMIAATGNPKTKAGFEPMVPGFFQVEPGDIAALEAAIDAETAGIIMEPIQGEGGVNLHSPAYVQQVRQLCDKHRLALIFDEVWTGCGRTGKWFAHQYFAKEGTEARRHEGTQHSALSTQHSVLPDVMTLGKAVGGGLPVGVMWARPEIAAHLVPGTHGCTLGANGICMAVARTVFNVIEREGLLQHASSLGERAISRLRNEKRIAAKVRDVRGRGLMLGIELTDPIDQVVEKGLQRGVIFNLTAGKVIRLAPPLNISAELWDQGLDMLIETLAGA